MKCKHGFKLDIKKIKTCDCGNLRGKYRSDGEIAEIYAKHPNHARFIGIPNRNNPKFESLRDEFLDINDADTWKKWEQGHLVQTMKEWEGFISHSDYCIGTVESLKKCNWHHRWVYCEGLCFHDCQ
jgi:hypothetical protein